MKIEYIKDGKWILDMPNNKKWSNTCDTCCLECNNECEEHCGITFKDGCDGCELDK